MACGVCSVTECSAPATRVGAGLCETHYCRQRRTGTVAPRLPPAPTLRSHGYVLERDPAHPLAMKGSVYQHRRVAYDHHGGTCPDCYWCGVTLSWASCHVDHLNGRKADNRPENLVVACAQCNRARGAFWPMVEAMTATGFDAFVRLAKEMRANC